MDQKKNNIKQTLITVFTGVFSVVISLSVMSMMQKQNDAIISFATLSDLQNMYSNPTEEDLKGKQFAVGNEIYEYSEGQWRSTGEITNAVAVRYITEEGAPGKDGADGVDGKDGVNGLDGKNGVDGINGTDGKDGKDGVDGEDGLDGKDGRDGVDGKDGKNGVDGINGKDGKDGLNGKDGKDGIDGKDGRDGRDGIDGKDGLTTSVNGVQHIDGNITITLDDIEDGQQRLLSPIADETNLGQVMVGEGLSVDNTGLVSVNLGDGLEVDNNGKITSTVSGGTIQYLGSVSKSMIVSDIEVRDNPLSGGVVLNNPDCDFIIIYVTNLSGDRTGENLMSNTLTLASGKSGQICAFDSDSSRAVTFKGTVQFTYKDGRVEYAVHSGWGRQSLSFEVYGFDLG